MSFNSYLGVFSAGLAANLPSAPAGVTFGGASSGGDLPAIPRFYFATDTLGLYEYDSANAAYVLLFQLKPVTVASLPTANLKKGTLAMVSDSNITTGGLPGDTVAGSGTKQVLVSYSTGTTWLVV